MCFDPGIQYWVNIRKYINVIKQIVWSYIYMLKKHSFKSPPILDFKSLNKKGEFIDPSSV